MSNSESSSKKEEEQLSRPDLIRKLLKGIETGDPESAAVVNESKYIQHNPQTQEGGEGLAVLFARLSKTNPRVNVVRAFQDGDYVFGNTEYDFATRRIGFEVFRFEGNQAVEHWDNIQPRMGPNASGHSMVDGPTEATDHDKTETNRALVQEFTNAVMLERNLSKLSDYVAESLIQHDPRLVDGLEAFKEALERPKYMQYDKLHRILAEGNFVLTVCEGFFKEDDDSASADKGDARHSAFYDLYRLEDGKIQEHWDTIEAVPPKSEWKNNNGKF